MSSSAMDLYEQSFNINNGRAAADWMIANGKCTNSSQAGGSAGSTPVKKMLAIGRTTTEFQRTELDEVDEDTPVNGHNESTETLVADLNQSVTELKQKLTNAVDIVDQMDRTLNESAGLTIESEDERRSMPLTTNPMKAKSTQTTDSWRMNIINPPLFVHKFAMPKMSSDLEENMRAECKELMRKHIETLREHMKVRVFLLHAKRKGLSSAEKKNGHEKFKALMDEFDEAKRKIKADFKRAGADKGVLAKHCVEIDQLQRETRWLQTKLEQILCSKNATVTSQFSSMTNLRQSGSSPKAFNFVNMEKRTDFVEADRNNSLDNFLLLGADTFSGQKPPLSAISPQIPPLNFDQLSVSDVSCNEGLVVHNHPTPPPIEHTEQEEKQAEKLSDGSMAAISSKARKTGNVSEALMDEFDEAKRKIKADFKRAGADKGVLAKHCVEIGQLQRETRWLQTKLEQILCSKNAVVTSQFSSMTNLRQSGSSPTAFNFVNMEKRTDFVEADRNNSLDNFLLLGADTFSGQKPPLSAISPQIPPLNFDQLSVSDVSCNEGLVVHNHSTPPPIEHTEQEEKQAEKLSDGSMAAISSKARKTGNVSESGFAHSSTSHKTVNDQKIDNESNALIESRVEDEEVAKGADDNTSFSELTSGGGNTSDDITSIPFPSEAGKVEGHLDGQTAATMDNVPTDEKKAMVFDGLNNGDGTPTSSRRFKYKVRMEEMAQVEASAHAHQMDTELHSVVHNGENAAQTEHPVVEQGLDDDEGDDQSERTETQSELADSVFEEPTENSTTDEREGTGRERSSNSFDAAKEEEEVEVISAKSLGRTLSLTQRTLAEIESIPEEMSPNDYAESAPKSASVMSEKIGEEVEDLQKTEDSITEEISEDVAFSFKPSEKSLRSILSVRSNSISTSARDSLGKLRRDSASEALLKLRTMNCVPELRSPRESKSPPKPLKSPRGVERFMAKFPNNSSRETSFSEELSVKGEMLEELPNTSQLGMLFELSCASADGTLSKLDSSSDSKRRQSGNAFNIAGMDKRADSVDLRKMEKRDSLSNFSVPEGLDANRILLAQYVYAHLSIWPTQETLMETDIEIINGL
uniref:PH domain-containing protein n=1 Tax=Globodera pallida TaxID=36090 RepID=A0A183CE26_GLOPA